MGVSAICTRVNAAAAGGIHREYTPAMRLRPLLLHALLSLALMANGIGGAMASVHAACAHDTIAAAAPAAAEAPCHEDPDASNAHSGMPDVALPHGGMLHDGMLDNGMPDNGMDQSSVSPHASTPGDESCGDCADHCQCACIANGIAILMPSTLLLHAVTGIAYTSAPSYTHAAPALPHPVRPPIG